jgi:hypothetical protein
MVFARIGREDISVSVRARCGAFLSGRVLYAPVVTGKSWAKEQADIESTPTGFPAIWGILLASFPRFDLTVPTFVAFNAIPNQNEDLTVGTSSLIIGDNV